MDCAELEIGLFYREAGSYAVELRYLSPNSDVRRPSALLVQFDEAILTANASDSEAYGRILSEALFKDPDLKRAFIEARRHAEQRKLAVRMRLFFGPNAWELHDLRWETLQAPDENRPLFTSDNVLFSRYLSSYDWRPVRLGARGDLNGLVVVASPEDIDQHEVQGGALSRIDTNGELSRARTAMQGIALTELVSPGKATLDGIVEALKSGYDILYLVCHGALINKAPHLWLETNDGTSDIISGCALLDRLRELENGPRFVVLASCQSGASGDDFESHDNGALAALGPQMAATGIPAVVAMQWNISATTVARFMTRFFSELVSEGQIDRAMAIARKEVRDRPDWWVPVLFLRMRSGRIWYSTGSTSKLQDTWDTILAQIKRGKLTPILGPGLMERLFGSRREIAQRWAKTFRFPMDPCFRDDLPQVAQYLAITKQVYFVTSQLIDFAKKEINERYEPLLSKSIDKDNLDEMVSAIGSHFRNQSEDDPHRVLAELDLPIYITTNFNNLMADALKERGKTPIVDFVRWKEELEDLENWPLISKDYEPTKESPLVYHLLGRLSVEESLVITQDDYFDFLIGSTKNRDLIPYSVRKALCAGGLLMLGFHLNDWEFRVLFRSVLSLPGSADIRRYAHVAAQVDPEEEEILEPDGARAYLESYFETHAPVSIYWGDSYEFATELRKQIEPILPKDDGRKSVGKEPITDRFDVFLCHNSEDKSAVKDIGSQLLKNGLRPWLDEWELRPGLRWQPLLEKQIDKIDAAAVFVGPSGMGPWQNMELDAFLREFVERNCPVIPVILPGISQQPQLPKFLKGMTWVDFRQNEPDPLERLIWGITGKRPGAR